MNWKNVDASGRRTSTGTSTLFHVDRNEVNHTNFSHDIGVAVEFYNGNFLKTTQERYHLSDLAHCGYRW
jgi:hypothetical protein